METILNIKISPDKVEIEISAGQKATVYKFGDSYYSTVSELILKSSIRPLALLCNSFFRDKSATKEFEIREYVNKQLKTVYDS